MYKKFINGLWVIAAIVPLFFWREVILMFNTEYDENLGHFFVAMLISFFNVFILMLLYKDYKSGNNLKFWIYLFNWLFASPITMFLVFGVAISRSY